MIRNSFKKTKVCKEPFNVLVVITYATSGISYYTVRKCASMGARFLMINRNFEKIEKLIEEIKRDFGTEVKMH